MTAHFRKARIRGQLAESGIGKATLPADGVVPSPDV